MLQESVALGRHWARDLSVRLAQSPSEIREAQKLRWRDQGGQSEHRPEIKGITTELNS